MKTVMPPRSPGNRWGYWRVESFIDLPAAMSRRRTSQAFIPTPRAFAGDLSVPCAKCGRPVTAEDAGEDGDGVRGTWHPKRKDWTLMHYYCAWGATLDEVVTVGRKLAGY